MIRMMRFLPNECLKNWEMNRFISAALQKLLTFTHWTDGGCSSNCSSKSVGLTKGQSVPKSFCNRFADPAGGSAQSKNPRNGRGEVVRVYRAFDLVASGHTRPIDNEWNLDFFHRWVAMALAFAAMVRGHDDKGLLANTDFGQSGQQI